MLAETLTMIPDAQSRLRDFLDDLQQLMVRRFARVVSVLSLLQFI
jgi:hypothetical protein